MISEGSEDSMLEVVKLFTQSGVVKGKSLETAYQQYRFHNENQLLFKTLEELGTFAMELASDLNCAEIKIISNVDYNIGADASTGVSNFSEVFNKYGNIVENSEQGKKKGVLGRLFN